MSVLHTIVLGLVQGLTEFLPVSSSWDLTLVLWLFDGGAWFPVGGIVTIFLIGAGRLGLTGG